MNIFNFQNLLLKTEKGLFVQIGSNDGISNDEYGLKNKLFNEEHIGILIEPVPDFYNLLKQNYRNVKSKIYFEPIAITEEDCIRDINVKGMDTSFVRGNIGPTLPVVCKNFDYIIEKYKIEKIDGLVLDTEGYEYNILNSIFSSKNVPIINYIRYEFWWVKEKEELDNLLKKNNFLLFQDNNSYADKIAINKTFFEKEFK